MGKFRRIVTALSARGTIMAGYYSLTFLFIYSFIYLFVTHMLGFSLREFDPHLPDYYYIKAGLVGYCISICF